MPRAPRIQLEGAVYLVTARGLSEEPLFKDAVDYGAYLQLLADYQQRHGFRVYAWCLLPDGIHLCLEPGQGGDLSRIMHDLSASFTRYVNKRYGRVGHLFQARYKAVVVEKATRLAEATAHVHLSPVRAGHARQAEAYPYSSLRGFAGEGTSGPTLDTASVIAALPVTVAGYADYVRHCSQMLPTLAERFQSLVVGSDGFVAAARASGNREEADPVPVTAGKPGFAPPRPRPRPAVLAGSAVALVAGLTLSITLLSRRVVLLERALVALAQENEATFLAGQSVAQASLAPQLRDLHGTRWDVRMTSLLSHAAIPDEDQLEFGERRVTSTMLAAQGFGQSPYLMRSRPDGRGTWETAHTNAHGDLVLWQGEWRGSVMQGMVTRQPAGKPPERFTFVAVLRETDDAGRES